MEIQNNLTESQPAILLLTEEDAATSTFIENALLDTLDIERLIQLANPFGTN